MNKNGLKISFSKSASTAFVVHKIKVLCSNRTDCQGKFFPETL